MQGRADVLANGPTKFAPTVVVCKTRCAYDLQSGFDRNDVFKTKLDVHSSHPPERRYFDATFREREHRTKRSVFVAGQTVRGFVRKLVFSDAPPASVSKCI